MQPQSSEKEALLKLFQNVNNNRSRGKIMTTLKQEISHCVVNGKDKGETWVELAKFPHLSSVSMQEFNQKWDIVFNSYQNSPNPLPSI